jgi:uncharacterized protein YoxC
MQSQLFFFISSIGFIILGILLAIVLIHLISAMTTFKRIIDKAEKDIDKLGDTTKEMLEDVRQSTVFHFLFKPKRRKKE